MSDDGWIDATRLGAAYVEQINTATGRWRHRRQMPPPPPFGAGFSRALPDFWGLDDGEWMPGKAPDNL